MKLTFVAAACLLLLSGRALAGQQDQSNGDTAAAPANPAPTANPPAPPETPPAPPADSGGAASPDANANAPAPTGQWVYTQQYGWVWMPYGAQYTYEPTSEGSYPYTYVYYPAWAAWTWVAAPWVWGWGPVPWFGVAGGFCCAG